MSEFFTASPAIAWSLVSVMLALVATSLLWTKVIWWWHNTWYSFPLIGKISSLSTDTNNDSSDSTWFKAEKTLCRDYNKFIRLQDEHDFNEKVTYLTKAGDNGRKEMPGLIWILTIGLVIVEALGFAYILAGYTLPGASENMQQMGAYGIAFLISVILVAFTHFSGNELHKSGKIQYARQEWIENGRIGKTTTGTVPLAHHQSSDDGHPGYVQLMNRVGTRASYYASIFTVIFVIIVAVGATYVRGQVLEKQLHQLVVGQRGSSAEQSVLASDGLDMSFTRAALGIQLPAADVAENRRASDKALADDVSIDRAGGWGTFIVLAFIFIFLQVLGVFFGFRWGFAGKDSEAAYRAIGAGRYSSYADVREHYKDIAGTAQSKLENLQQKLMNRNSMSGNDGLHTTKTFYDFINAERVRETDDRAKEMRNATQREAMEKAQSSHIAASQNISKNPESLTIDNETLASAMQKLQTMGDDKEAKIRYIQGLPNDLNGQVKQALKEKKQAAAQKAMQRDTELDDLLS